MSTKIESNSGLSIFAFDCNIEKLVFREDNYRSSSQAGDELLDESMTENPFMIELREVVIDEDFVVWAGEQRVKSAIRRGEKTIRVKQVGGLEKDELERFAIQDNEHSGKWIKKAISKLPEIDQEKYTSIGISIPKPKEETKFNSEFMGMEPSPDFKQDVRKKTELKIKPEFGDVFKIEFGGCVYTLGLGDTKNTSFCKKVVLYHFDLLISSPPIEFIANSTYKELQDTLENSKALSKERGVFYIFLPGFNDLRVAISALNMTGYIHKQCLVAIYPDENRIQPDTAYKAVHDLVLFGWKVEGYPGPITRKESVLKSDNKSGIIDSLVWNSTQIGDSIYNPYGDKDTILAAMNANRNCFSLFIDQESLQDALYNIIFQAQNSDEHDLNIIKNDKILTI